MKNTHVIPTDKPSRLFIYNENLGLSKEFQYGSNSVQNQNIYITNSEVIKEGDCVLDCFGVHKVITNNDGLLCRKGVRYSTVFLATDSKKIVLTTDRDLIKEGIQGIPDDFLEWFIKNPSCEEIYVNKIELFDFEIDKYVYDYKIVIPNIYNYKNKNNRVTTLNTKKNDKH